MDDVFRHDDGGIDQKSNRNGQAPKSHRVDADSQGFQKQAREKNGQWQRDRYDERGAHVPQEHKENADHEKRAEKNGAAHSTERASHQSRLVVHDPQLHAFRQALLNVFDRFAYALRNLNGVRAKLLHDAATDHLTAKTMRDSSANGRSFANLGNVRQRDRCGAVHRHDRAAEVFDFLHSTHGAQRPFHRALYDEAARGIFVRALNGMHHFGQRNFSRGHALGVELHLKLPQVAAQAFDRGHTGHRKQPIPHIELRKIAKRHQVGRARLGL